MHATAITPYICFYNHKLPHQALDYRPPAACNFAPPTTACNFAPPTAVCNFAPPTTVMQHIQFRSGIPKELPVTGADPMSNDAVAKGLLALAILLIVGSSLI